MVDWAGLKPSIGKTLVSPVWGTINSRLVRFYDRVGPCGTPYREPVLLPHCQLQLALGSMKSGQYDLDGRIISQGDPATEGRMWSEFLETCPRPAHAWKFLWGVNREYLLSLTRMFPRSALCLPAEAGGLGFPLPPPDSPFYSARSPRSTNLLLARMLLEEGTPSQHCLRSQWLSLLRQHNDSSVENILFREISDLQRRTGCPLLRVRREEAPETTVPLRDMYYRVSTTNVIEGEESTLSQRRSLYLRCLKELRSFGASGRGPWTVAVVNSFLREYSWDYMYGRFCSAIAS